MTKIAASRSAELGATAVGLPPFSRWWWWWGGGAQQACHCWSSGRSGLASGLGGMRACLCRLSGRTRLARCQGLQALPLLAFGPQLACFWARGHAGLPLSGFGLQKSCPLPGLAGLATAGIRAAVGAASRLSGWLALVGLRATAGLPPLLGPRRACLHCWCACPPPVLVAENGMSL